MFDAVHSGRPHDLPAPGGIAHVRAEAVEGC